LFAMEYLLSTSDVIVAVSSPAGRAERGIVRASGPGVFDLAGKVFRPKDGDGLAGSPAWRFLPGWFDLGGGGEVPALAVVFRAPRSYTGQDLVEFHLPGSPTVLEMAVRSLVRAGARPAGPGEFTCRAFLSGRLDLTAAEAVASIIAARSDDQLRAARRLSEGTLRRLVEEASDDLSDLLSLVEASIDFAEEPIEFIGPADLRNRLEQIADRLRAVLARAVDSTRLEVLPTVAVVGPANAGKSSLVNRLSGLDRSICSPMPGTTRDVLCAPAGCDEKGGGQVLLLDGPGFGPAGDALDLEAQRAWRDMIGRCDLVLLVLDGTRLLDGDAAPAAAGLEGLTTLVRDRPHLVAVNKVDLLSEQQRDTARRAAARLVGREVLLVSALTGYGCDRLRRAMVESAGAAGGVGSEQIVLTARHRESLERALEAIEQACLLAEQIPGVNAAGDLVAVYLREALEWIGQVSGRVTTEDLLGRIFSRFCIGK